MVKNKLPKNMRKILICILGCLFIGGVLAPAVIPFRVVSAQEAPFEQEVGVIDKAIKLTMSILDKLTFVKAIWGKIVGVYGQIKAVLVGVWDKYLDKYLGKYVVILKENIKQGIEEEREEIRQLMTNDE